MKKFGFTLSEILVTIAVIGVISSIVVPMVGDILPDQDKMKVLKCYKTIVDINKEILSDPSLYWTPANSNCTGLYCYQQPINPDYDDSKFSGFNKYLLLFASKLDSDFSGNISGSQSVASFRTPDGIDWKLELSGLYTYTITVDLDDSANSTNAVYDATTKKPDRFSFYISPDGKVSAGDSLTKAYLSNPYKMNDKKKDYEAAKNLK